MTGKSGYERARYRDFTTNLGGPIVRDRLWFFTGYQHLRDYDSQPGTDPAFPRTYEKDKIFAKLTWKLTPGLQLLQSFHHGFWVKPELHQIARRCMVGERAGKSLQATGVLDDVRARRRIHILPAGRGSDSRHEIPARDIRCGTALHEELDLAALSRKGNALRNPEPELRTPTEAAYRFVRSQLEGAARACGVLIPRFPEHVTRMSTAGR
jgi:hypothetical protein